VPIHVRRRVAETIVALRPDASSATARRFWEWIVPSALYLALVLFVFRRVFFPGDAGRAFFGWDTLNSYWPDFAYRFRTLWRGELPLWNPYEIGGVPFAPNPQTMLFYPPSWLLALFALPDGRLSVFGPQFFAAFHFLIVGLGAHALARRIGADRLCAFLAGTTAILCAPVLSQRNSNFLYPIAWLPWLLVAIDRLAELPCRKNALGLAACGILAGSAANPPGVFVVVWTAGLFACADAPYLVGRTMARSGRRSALSHLGRFALWGAVAAAVALCYLAITYLPAVELAERSVRAERGTAYFLDRALTFKHLPGLFNAHQPQTWWFDLFVGIAPLLALGPALLFKPDRRAWILAVVAVLSVWVGIGEKGGLLLPAIEHLPGFSLNRKAYRYAVAMGVLAGPLAAYGLSAVLEVVRRRGAFGLFESPMKNRIHAAAAVAIACAAILLLAPGAPAKASREAVLGAEIVPWIAAGLAALLCAGLLVPRLGERFVVAAFAVVLAAQGAHLYWSAQDRLALVQTWSADAEARYARSIPSTSPEFRAGIKGPARTGFGARELVRFTGGYEIPLMTDRQQSFMRWAKSDLSRLRLFNLRYVHSGKKPGNGTVPRGGSHWELEDPVPLVAVYSGVSRIPDGAALKRWNAADAKGLALVENGDWSPVLDGLEATSGLRTAGALSSYGANEISATVTAASRGLAVFNEVYFPGWRAFVDGRETPVIRCNHLLRGVAVGRGEHSIVLRYWPTRYGVYLLLLAASLLGLAALGIGPALVRSRPRRA
jgi:hypothetical protein